jgi:hypothetical protein
MTTTESLHLVFDGIGTIFAEGTVFSEFLA